MSWWPGHNACLYWGFSIAEHISGRSHRSAMTPKMFVALCYAKYCRHYILSRECFFCWEGKYPFQNECIQEKTNRSTYYTTRKYTVYMYNIYYIFVNYDNMIYIYSMIYKSYNFNKYSIRHYMSTNFSKNPDDVEHNRWHLTVEIGIKP